MEGLGTELHATTEARKLKRLLEKKVGAVVLKALKRNFCTVALKTSKILGKRMKQVAKQQSRVDSPPLRYVAVMTQSCIMFMLFVLLKG